jgi:hypothetical protein
LQRRIFKLRQVIEAVFEYRRRVKFGCRRSPLPDHLRVTAACHKAS